MASIPEDPPTVNDIARQLPDASELSEQDIAGLPFCEIGLSRFGVEDVEITGSKAKELGLKLREFDDWPGVKEDPTSENKK